MISLVERGHVARMHMHTLRAISGALDARVDLDVRWQGAGLDRLLDERHARLVEVVVEVLAAHGWVVHPEASFNVYGDRGSIDILAWHDASRSILVIEVKTELAAIEDTFRRFDVKVRVAPVVVQELTGWRPGSVSSALVVLESTTARRRVADHRATFAARLTMDPRGFKRWLGNPVGARSDLWFLPLNGGTAGTRAGRTPDRVRVPRRPDSEG